jgi:hypothetical protein
MQRRFPGRGEPVSALFALQCAALAGALALSACVPVDDGRLPRELATGGTGGGASGGGGGSGAGPVETGGQGGSGGLDPANPVGGNEADAGGLPRPNVGAIFETGCATTTVEAELREVNLLFVLDRSASMLCNPPPTTDSTACEGAPERADQEIPSKWEITREALSDAISALPAQIVVGISYFPNDDGCGVISRPRIPLRELEQTQVAAINASLASITPSGATPLVGATILAYQHLHEQALAGKIRGERFVVLLTDGEQSASCSDSERCNGAVDCTKLLVDHEVGKASGPGVGIRTFVIGVPGSENAVKVLSAIAEEGLTAPADCEPDAGNCHFDMTMEPDFGTALASALEQIVGRALTCELPLPDAEDFEADRVNVVYSSSLGEPPRVVPRDDTKACNDGAEGWQYLPDGKSVRLCGKVCEDARQDQAGRMDVVLGCPVQGPD